MTSFLKVFEKTWSIRLTEHFYSNKLLVGNQFGFRKGIATEEAILKLINEILNALNNKTLASSIFVIWRKLSAQLIMIYYCLHYLLWNKW